MGRTLIVNKPRILEVLERISSLKDREKLRNRLAHLKQDLSSAKKGADGLLNIDENGETVRLSRTYLLDEIEHIRETHTLERSRYYLTRLQKAIAETKTGKINDINLNRWKEYDDLLTDSLWLLPRRDTSGLHSSWYWGNFIPQIPHQLMLRYTKAGDWVVDTFAGSGTTLLECQRLGRNGFGVELQPKIAKKAGALLKKGWKGDSDDFSRQRDNGEPRKVHTAIDVGDSATVDFGKLLKAHGGKSAQLLIMHPPYHDIIKFSDNRKDLSNAPTVDSFLEKFGKVLDNTYGILDKGRYLGVVIGDKYSEGEWIPLGFRVMQEVLARGYTLKSIVVKNFEETAAKRNLKELWRYRALVGGFYVFKHEYIFVFRK